MSPILSANLKHLYQRRGIWAGHLLLAIAISLSILVPFGILRPLQGQTEGLGLFVGLVATAFLVGLQASALQMEILAKSFSFCLPGYRQVVRRFIFTVGMVSNMLGCLLFLAYPRVPTGYVPVVLASAFCAGLVFYLASVWAAFSSGQPLASIGFVGVAFYGSLILNLHVLLEKVIVEKPLLVVTVGVVVAGMMWSYLSAEKLARRNCLRPFFDFGMAFNPERVQRFQRMKGEAFYLSKLKDHPREWVETWFLGQMNRCRAFSPARYVWGSLYVTYALALSRWKTTLFFIPFLAVFLGYTGRLNEHSSGYLQMGVFIAPIMVLMYTRLPLYSTMPIAGGRDQRLVSTLATVAVGWLSATLFFGSIILLSIPLAALLPDIHFSHLDFQYQVVDPHILYCVLAVLPLVYVAQLLSYKKPIAMMIVLIATFILVSSLSMASRFKSQISLSLGTAAALTVLLWAVFVGVLHRIARSRSLIR